MPRPAVSNRIRIIGGQWRSRVIEFPAADGLRPTPDRVRETLFNWLGQDLTGKRCLDLFAGAGGLGFEALSRNAARVSMIESAANAHRALQANAQKLEAGNRLRLLRADALEFLRGEKEFYDVVFLDPPYGTDLHERVWPLLSEHLAPGALVYAEKDVPIVLAQDFASQWQVLKSGRAGSVYFYLFGRIQDNNDE